MIEGIYELACHINHNSLLSSRFQKSRYSREIGKCEPLDDEYSW